MRTMEQENAGFVKVETPKDAIQILAKKRRSLGISQKQLAEFANLAPTTVGEIERSEVDPRFSNLLDLLRYCKIEIYIKP